MCPVCIQISDKPVETTCQHYFSVECTKGVIDSGQGDSRPVCEETIGPLKVPTRTMLCLIAEQEVTCTNCRKSVNYEDSAAHVCNTTQAQATIPNPQQPAVVPPHGQALEQILTDAKGGENMHCLRKSENEGVSKWQNCAFQHRQKGIFLFLFNTIYNLCSLSLPPLQINRPIDVVIFFFSL